MKEHLIGLTASAAMAPAALGFGIHSTEKPVICEPLKPVATQTQEESTLSRLHLSDLPLETKVVVTLAAIALTTAGANKAIRGKEYGDDWEKGSDIAAAATSAALGAAVIVATWYPF